MKNRQRSSRQPPFLSENKSQPWPFLVSAGFLVLCCCVLSSAFASVALFYSLFNYYLIIKFIQILANYYINFAKIFSFKKVPSAFASLALLPFWFTLNIISHLLFSRKKDPPALGNVIKLRDWHLKKNRIIQNLGSTVLLTFVGFRIKINVEVLLALPRFS